MKREIIDTTTTCEPVKMDGFASNPAEWLSQQMQTYGLKYLLAHTDDGVIWGRLDGTELITSHGLVPEYSPPLRAETLLTARVFSRAGELLVWRDESGEWAGRLIIEDKPDATAEWTRAFEEKQVLFGTHAQPKERGFALMREGSQGLFHAVPLDLSGPIDEEERPLRLIVRHYLKEDKNGFVRVNASRLVGLLPEPEESNA
ncbi:MAG TPA: CRISPR-associated protein Csx19 [Ktedonobacteraceae bacterium]|jgi:CRISPR-associated protein (TIGR03984 family)|nr:CRISPR-associated protein Csx19 [Ktedonobacteraceae bacterium]